MEVSTPNIFGVITYRDIDLRGLLICRRVMRNVYKIPTWIPS